MKEGGKLFFAPGIRFIELDFADVPRVVGAFEARIMYYYLAWKIRER